MNTIETMKLALLSLEEDDPYRCGVALRQAIEQMEKVEPVAFRIDYGSNNLGEQRFYVADSVRRMQNNLAAHDIAGLPYVVVPLYTHPAPLRELTDEEIEEVWHTELDNRQLSSIRAILAKARGE